LKVSRQRLLTSPHRQQQWECSFIFEKAKKSHRAIDIVGMDCVASFGGRFGILLYGLILHFEMQDAACRLHEANGATGDSRASVRIDAADDNRKMNYKGTEQRAY